MFACIAVTLYIRCLRTTRFSGNLCLCYFLLFLKEFSDVRSPLLSAGSQTVYEMPKMRRKRLFTGTDPTALSRCRDEVRRRWSVVLFGSQRTFRVCDVTSRLRTRVSVCRTTNESIIASLIRQDSTTFGVGDGCRIINPVGPYKATHEVPGVDLGPRPIL